MDSSATMENIYLDARDQLLQPMLTCEAAPHTPTHPAHIQVRRSLAGTTQCPRHESVTWMDHTAVLQLGYTTA